MILPNFDYEKSLLPSGCRYLLGIDEAGRGPWAGPLTLCGFLIDLKTFNPQIFAKLSVRDSKKLSHSQRQKIVSHLEQQNYSYKIIHIESQAIDNQGISASLSSGITQILHYFRGSFDFCLIDGNELELGRENIFSAHSERVTPQGDSPKVASTAKKLFSSQVGFIIKADANCFSVATASIIAKESRDALMDTYDLQYPQYGFASHKGYGTSQHLKALQTHGPCPIHRFSYKPIKSLPCEREI